MQSTEAPLIILTAMRNNVSGLTVIMTCLQADTLHALHRHNAIVIFLLVPHDLIMISYEFVMFNSVVI